LGPFFVAFLEREILKKLHLFYRRRNYENKEIMVFFGGPFRHFGLDLGLRRPSIIRNPQV
jgi:hypothetical protein